MDMGKDMDTYSLLPQPPQVVLKKTQPTNYQQNNKCYIAPHLLKTYLLQIVANLSQSNSTPALLPPHQQRQHFLSLTMLLRKANEFNKLVNEQSIDLFIQVNLGHFYRHLNMEKFAMLSYEKSIRILNQHCLKLKYLEIMPDNYFAPNHKFYSVMVQRYYAHFTRGRGKMGLATACSIAIKHQQANQFCRSAYMDFLKAGFQLLISYVGSLIRFLVKHRYLIRNRSSGPHSSAHSNRRFSHEQEPMIEIQFKNYEICVNTLFKICKQEGSRNAYTQDPKLQMLKSILNDQCRALEGYTHYNFQSSAPFKKDDYLTEKMKKARFLDLAAPKAIEKFQIFDQANNWGTVQVEIDLVYELTMYITATLYAISIQSKFTEEPKEETREMLRQFGVEVPARKMKKGKMDQGKISESEHWLGRALELSYHYLQNTSLFFQIKSIYTSTHPTKVEEEIIQEVSEDYEEFNINGKKRYRYQQIQPEGEEEEREILNLLESSKMTNNNGIKIKDIKIPQQPKAVQEQHKGISQQIGRISRTAPQKQLYESWRFSMGKNDVKTNKQYEIKTLKYGGEMIPMVIRQAKQEEMAQKRYERNQQKRDIKYYQRSLEVRGYQEPEQKFRQKQKRYLSRSKQRKPQHRQTYLQNIRKAYEGKEGNRRQHKIRSLINYSAHTHGQGKKVFNTINPMEMGEPENSGKKREIGYARYEFKHIRGFEKERDKDIDLDKGEFMG